MKMMPKSCGNIILSSELAKVKNYYYGGGWEDDDEDDGGRETNDGRLESDSGREYNGGQQSRFVRGQGVGVIEERSEQY